MENYDAPGDDMNFILPAPEDFGTDAEKTEVRKEVRSFLQDLHKKGFDPSAIATAVVEAASVYHEEEDPLRTGDWSHACFMHFHRRAKALKGRMRFVQEPCHQRYKAWRKKAH
ncbi:MAG: hypothetical protein AAFQ66_08845 [Pseudomonadota bacterium]